jgi:hypothetical protein
MIDVIIDSAVDRGFDLVRVELKTFAASPLGMQH